MLEPLYPAHGSQPVERLRVTEPEPVAQCVRCGSAKSRASINHNGYCAGCCYLYPTTANAIWVRR